MSQEDLERRIRRLEDIEEIKQLKHRYCAACDDTYDTDAIVSLFTEDAVWDGGIWGKFEGGKRYGAFSGGRPKSCPLRCTWC